MGLEKRTCLILENVEPRAGARIDFEKRIGVVYDQKIYGVEPSKPAGHADRGQCFPQLMDEESNSNFRIAGFRASTLLREAELVDNLR